MNFQSFCSNDGSLYRKVLFRGLPEMIAQFATPVTTICMNHVLMAQLGERGINAFSIISYIASLTLSVLAGASEGLQPLFGQSYGAKNERDLKYYFRSGIALCVFGNLAIVLLAVALNIARSLVLLCVSERKGIVYR